MFSTLRSTTPGIAVIVVGALPTAAFVVWAFVIGFYTEDLPVLIALGVVGGGLLWLGQKMFQEAKRNIARDAIEARDAGGSR
ncbi:hypothetical protein IGS67_04445 [Flavimobilis sp. GY10621]|uniref:Uncharacterized protein n=1 Tax=Flavimobilis rhizosphaerae TaxID=2775421 RepID=A0ABR9DNP6_9MICO|nr:hypothetical protein [Flavimobilis rhizosphaerae]MBD9698747.1 hypothetical protein [Flavimobilis rhizosphaerae]